MDERRARLRRRGEPFFFFVSVSNLDPQFLVCFSLRFAFSSLQLSPSHRFDLFRRGRETPTPRALSSSLGVVAPSVSVAAENRKVTRDKGRRLQRRRGEHSRLVGVAAVGGGELGESGELIRRRRSGGGLLGARAAALFPAPASSAPTSSSAASASSPPRRERELRPGLLLKLPHVLLARPGDVRRVREEADGSCRGDRLEEARGRGGDPVPACV